MPTEADYLALISGRSRGIGPALARTGLLAIEPLYRGIIRTRNTLFDQQFKASHYLGKPTISVGNITTGGTGKTPVVQWLADRLIQLGHHPAILLRGYRSTGGVSDEAELLKRPGVEVEANPDRVTGAMAVLARSPQTDVFILDDGFQHRRARRNFDLVLIDATNPFGHGHVLPRGLLREPPSSLARAGAILITHADAEANLSALKLHLRQHAPAAPIFASHHAFGGLIDADGRDIDLARVGRCLAVAGIGNPDAFYHGLRSRGLHVVDTWSPGDHHAFTPADVQRLREHGIVDTIVVTEKDWVKLKAIRGVDELPIARAKLRIDFADGDADALLTLILQKCPFSPSS